MHIRLRDRITLVAVPAEEAPEGKPEREQRADGARGRRATAFAQGVDAAHRPSRAAAVELDDPRVVQRHVVKQRVTAEVERLELAHGYRRLIASQSRYRLPTADGASPPPNPRAHA